ncbi:MAG: hypothetical protein ACOX2F_08720 [bacterium]
MANLLLFSITLFDKSSILEKATQNGFNYKAVEITEVNKCPENQFCVEFSGKNYLIKKKNNFEATEIISKKSIEINITPDSSYVSYFLYLEHTAGVHKVQFSKKKMVINSGVANIVKLQIVGTSSTGPEVIWEKQLKKQKELPFVNSFEESINRLRKSFFLPQLSKAKELKPASDKALSRLKKEGLIHYSFETGGIRHTRIGKKVLGENLFVAENKEKGWKMLINSPSHLYNLVNPQFKQYFISISEEKEGVAGAIVFSE